MMAISQLSRTAVLTLISRVVAHERQPDLYSDPEAALCLERLIPLLSEEDRRWAERERRIFSGVQSHHALAGARRARLFDDCAARFMAAHPHCTVVNLACGFDTRYWRLAAQDFRYMEVDLPEMAGLKRQVLADRLSYDLVGCSVLEESWLELVAAPGNRHILLLAEGLLPYLPEAEVAGLLQRISRRLSDSQIVLDVVPLSYTRGLWKQLMRLETRITWGMENSWVFGIRSPDDLVTLAPGLRLVDSRKGSAGPIVTLAINPA